MYLVGGSDGGGMDPSVCVSPLSIARVLKDESRGDLFSTVLTEGGWGFLTGCANLPCCCGYPDHAAPLAAGVGTPWLAPGCPCMAEL